MLVLILIAVVSLLASLSTFYSGFGLGTILTPFFCLFFPATEAIALTAVIHFINNIFKFSLLKNFINYSIAIPFTATAIIASLAGAELLNVISKSQYSYYYTIGSFKPCITPIKLIVSFLIIVFLILEQLPSFAFIIKKRIGFMVGGLFSGFFGGLSGNQGALRSMFLLKSGLTKESYIATGVFIACAVDCVRLTVYSSNWTGGIIGINLSLMVTATIFAVAGSLIGKFFLDKVTFKSVQSLIIVFLIVISILLGSGII